MNEEYGLVAQAEAAEKYYPVATWCETRACCLLHHRQMFWQAIWSQWVHSAGLRPCEAMEGEPDPNLLPCRYCGARLQVDGAGHLWSWIPEAERRPHWEKHPEGSYPRYTWHSDADTDKCPVSPTFRHEVRQGALTRVKS